MNIYFLADVSAGTLAVIYVVIFIIPAFLGVCWMPSLHQAISQPNWHVDFIGTS
jgi:hypothetical protein